MAERQRGPGIAQARRGGSVAAVASIKAGE
jgi:hypothetical protein